MRKRIITAVIGLGIMIPILVFGGVVGAAVLFALAAGFSVYEMLECCGMQKRASILIPAVLLSAFSVMFTYIPFLRFQPERAYLCAALVIIVLLVLFFFWLLWVCVLTPQKSDIEKVLMFFAMFLYITVGFCSLAALRRVGLFMIWFVLAVSWGCDTFAYFGGMAFGKKKLCPDISPKKTVAGAITGVLGGTLCGALVQVFFNCFDIGSLLSRRGLATLAVAAVLTVVSQFGDLSASLIKRKFGVKDYGRIFPGHGGVLDRFDSIIPVSVLLLVYVVVRNFAVSGTI